MKATWRVVVVMFVVLLGLLVGQAWATNPADPTSAFRYGTDFLKVAYDNIGTNPGYSWLFAQKEIGNRTAVLLYNEYDDGGNRLYELGVTKQVKAGAGTLEIGAFTDIWHGDEDDSGLMLDWSTSRFGLGTVLRANGCSKFEARTSVAKNTTLYLSLTESGAASPVWGIGQTVGKVRLDLAGDGKTIWLRATKPSGRFFPELRTKFAGGETFIGFGLGFTP